MTERPSPPESRSDPSAPAALEAGARRRAPWPPSSAAPTAHRSDRAVSLAAGACALLSGSLLLWVLVFVLREAAPALAGGSPARFLSLAWRPGEGLFGLIPLFAGTLGVSAGALCLAGPFGLGCALFVRFYAPAGGARALRALLALLAGVPSVVYGLWGLTVLVPLVARAAPPGASLLSGALVLALMILPTLALAADAALGAIPAEVTASAHALGLSRASVALRVALPAARSGLWTGAVLAVGRALGETMAVLLVCGNVPRLPRSPFDPVRTLAANVALEMGYALGEHRAALFVSALALLLLVGSLIALAHGLGGRRRGA